MLPKCERADVQWRRARMPIRIQGNTNQGQYIFWKLMHFPARRDVCFS
jgi:hypothetical protein